MDDLLTQNQYSVLVGRTLRRIRTTRSLSQGQFADAAKLGRTYYGAIERGEKSISAYKLYRLLKANGISSSAFFDDI